jgi:hypothetical protein
MKTKLSEEIKEVNSVDGKLVIKYIVTSILIARQRLVKHIPAQRYEGNNRTSISR